AAHLVARRRHDAAAARLPADDHRLPLQRRIQHALDRHEERVEVETADTRPLQRPRPRALRRRRHRRASLTEHTSRYNGPHPDPLPQSGRGRSDPAHTLVVAAIALADDSWLDFEPAWLSADEGARCLDAVRGEVEWVAREIVIYGKRIMQPRLVGWAGDVPYRYSGQTLEPRPFTDTVRAL